jgi:hypothetical protein
MHFFFNEKCGSKERAWKILNCKELDSVADVLARIGAGQPRNAFSISDRDRTFSVLQSVQKASGAVPAT